ncbi:hypothetical protein [Bacillus weihaiensis]|uniref:hypothetical protein n=1 Tax=Bacillus weihaiensis TaxID=1547283 RepID=UPI002352C49B|nr:hypothetical protein [Bacillus weihaiensis]
MEINKIMKNLSTDNSNSNKSLYHGKLITTIFILVYLFIDFLRLFEIIPLVIGNSLYVLLGSIAIVLSTVINGIRNQIPMFIFMFFYTFFGAIGIVLNGNMNIQELLWPFAFMGITLLFLNFGLPNKVLKYIFYFVCIFFITIIVISGGVDNLNMVSSRNTISIIVLFYFSLYAISNYTNNIKITIYPILLGLIVTIMAIGRSGIFTFSILMVLFLLFRFDGEKYKIRNPLKLTVILVVAGIILLVSYNFLEVYFAQTISNFENRGLDSVRDILWQDYINKTLTSAKYLFFGTPIGGTYLLDTFNNNLHNSLLMLHAKYGLLMFVIIVILIINTMVYSMKTKNIVFFILLIALLFRMQFDYTNFNAQLDIILFYLIFATFIKRNIPYKGTTL